MSWQKCPICNGIGSIETAPGLQSVVCDVCLGKKIIGENGLPPEIDIKSSSEVPDLSAEELMKPVSPLDELSDDEIQYWATPYYDELQSRKEAQKARINEEINLKGERHG